MEQRTAVAYLRVSTREQVTGLAVQRGALEAWARENCITIVAWCVDHGVSGGAELDKRPGLLAALVAVKEHKASLLAVQKRDRLSRDVYVAHVVERVLARTKATVFSVDGTGNGDSPADELMRTMLTAMAAYERKLIGQRSKAAKAKLKAEGRRTGRLPYGHTVAEGKRLVPHSGEQKVIRCARELRTAGASLRAIASQLTASGFRNRAGGAFDKVSVQRMLQG